MPEKETKINITKIYNWNEENQLVQLQLEFYSKQSEHLITRKVVKSTARNNYINVDISLRIRYTDSQNIIVIVITKLAHPKLVLGEVQIDLDQLTSQKMKYYTFGSLEKILQVQFGGIDSPLKQIKDYQINGYFIAKEKEKHRIFLQGRKRFLEDYKHTQNKLKTQFEQKITIILQQQNDSKRKPQRIKNVNFINSVEDNDQSQHRDIEDVKSEARKKRAIQIGRARSAIHQNPLKIQTRDSAIQNNHAQVQTPIKKHKLVLNTLNIVPKEDTPKKI